MQHRKAAQTQFPALASTDTQQPPLALGSLRMNSISGASSEQTRRRHSQAAIDQQPSPDERP